MESFMSDVSVELSKSKQVRDSVRSVVFEPFRVVLTVLLVLQIVIASGVSYLVIESLRSGRA